jgi:transcriptional regulator with XRE-family HTH domain
VVGESIRRYKIGRKIRALRVKKKLSLVQLAEHTGLSPGMLSKIETEAVCPTLPSLIRIALALGVGLEYFLVESSERPTMAVVRKSDRVKLLEGADEEAACYSFESLDFPVVERKMNAFLAEFSLRSKPSQPHQHDGAELIYIIKGQLVINVDGDDFSLNEGDSIYFDSGAWHAYRREGPSSCFAIVVIVAT